MKLEDARAFIGQHKGTPMSEIWSTLLQDQWQSGLLEVQALLEAVTIDDLALWHLSGGGGSLQDVVAGYFKRLALPHEFDGLVLSKVASSLMDNDKLEMLGKIANIAEDRGLNFLDFLVEAKASANLASQVQKNATKKGLYEPAAAAFIELRSKFEVMVLAHADTKISIRFSSSGQVGVNTKAVDPYSKDADLAAIRVDGGKCHVYLISHKYARVGGGHQMNQRSDAAKYLAYANEALLADAELDELRLITEKYLGASVSKESFSWEPALILDGDYFRNAPMVIRAEESYPKLRNTTHFIGDVDAFVSTAAL